MFRKMCWDEIETKLRCISVQLMSTLDAEDYKQFNEISEQQHDLIRRLHSDGTLNVNEDIKLFMQELIERTTTQIEKIEQRKKSLTRSRGNFVRVQNGYHP